MPALTIGRMAKMYRLHRSTLYEAVEKGRVTASFDGKGQRVIDLSEMIRVYGEPPGQPGKPDTNPTPSPDTPPDTAQAMLEELRAMRRELVALREEVAQLRALPAPKVDAEVDTVDTPRDRPEEKPHEPSKADTPADDTAPDWRSLVDALRRSEK